MKAISAKITKSLQVGSIIKCIDNTGAKELEIIAVRGYKGKRRAKPKAGIADWVICRVESGEEKVRHQIFKAVIVRQRREYRRSNGIRIQFEDNAAIIINEKGEPQGTLIKGPIAKEVVERYTKIGKIASIVV